MKLSIITITYNNLAGLQRTAASVLAQTATDFEWVIIDGDSTDGTKVYLDTLCADAGRLASHPLAGLQIVSEPDTGIYNAMNKGIRMAQGEYIQILNAGDCLAAADVTERMLSELSRLAQEKTVDILYGNMLKTSDWKHFVRDNGGANSNYTPHSFLYFYLGTLNHDCAYIRRQLFVNFGFYNESMRICSDWEWYVRTIVFGQVSVVYVDIDVTHFDMNGISESGNKNAEIIKRERRSYLEQCIPSAILSDYDIYAFPITQYQRLKKYHLWGLVYFVERILFKLEKWRILR